MPPGPPRREPFGLREHLATLFRYRGQILAVLLGAVVAALAGSFLLTRTYASVTRILIQDNRQSTPMSATLTPGLGQQVLTRNDAVRTEVEIFKSPLLVERVVDRLGPDTVIENMRWRWDWIKELPDETKRQIAIWLRSSSWSTPIAESLGWGVEPDSPRSRAITKMGENLEVLPVAKADIFAVSIQSPNPRFAALSLNTLVDVYLDQHPSFRRGDSRPDFFAEEARRLRFELTEAEAKLQTYREEYGIVDLDEQKQTLLRRIATLEESLDQVRVERIESDERIAAIRRSLESRSRQVPLSSISDRNPMFDRLNAELMALEREKSRFEPDSPAARQLAVEIDTLRGQLASVNDSVRRRSTSGVSTTYQALETALAMEKGKRRALDARVALVKLVDRQRFSLTALDQAESGLRSLELEVRIKNEALQLYMRKQEESRINAVMDRERILNVVQIEPATEPTNPIGSGRMRLLLLALAMGLIGGIGSAYLRETLRRTFATPQELEQVLGRPALAWLLSAPLGRRSRQRAEAENQIQIRRLCHSLERSGGKTFLFCSYSSGEGTSFTIFELQRYWQQAGKNVLRLAVGEDTAVAHDIDYLLIDAPAFNTNPDSLTLAHEVDKVVLVVQAERTARMSVFNMCREFEEFDMTVLGTVLNRRRLVIPNWAYSLFVGPRSGRVTA